MKKIFVVLLFCLAGNECFSMENRGGGDNEFDLTRFFTQEVPKALLKACNIFVCMEKKMYEEEMRNRIIRNLEDIRFFVNLVVSYNKVFPQKILPKKYDVEDNHSNWIIRCKFNNKEEKDILVQIAETILFMLLQINNSIEALKSGFLSEDKIKLISRIYEAIKRFWLMPTIGNPISDVELPVVLGQDDGSYQAVSLLGAINFVNAVNYYWLLKNMILNNKKYKDFALNKIKQYCKVDLKVKDKRLLFLSLCWKHEYKDALNRWLENGIGVDLLSKDTVKPHKYHDEKLDLHKSVYQ
jgi:hypothetical protein